MDDRTRNIIITAVIAVVAAFAIGRISASPEQPVSTAPATTSTSGSPSAGVDTPLDQWGELESVGLLRTLANLSRDDSDHGYYWVDRQLSFSYGDAFSAACDSFGASKSECDRAWQKATGNCMKIGNEPLCFDPVPGYGWSTDKTEKAFQTAWDKHVIAPIAALACETPADDTVARLCGEVVQGT